MLSTYQYKAKHAKTYFFEQLGCCFIAGQRDQSDFGSFNIRKNEQIIELYRKLCCSGSLEEREISSRIAAKFEGDCVAGCYVSLQKPPTDVRDIFNHEPAKMLSNVSKHSRFQRMVMQ